MRRLFLAAVVALVLAAGASADSVLIPLTVKPGSLTIVPARAVVRGTSAEVAVVDARGNGGGWQVVATPTGRPFTIAGADARCGSRSTCTLPRSAVHYPLALVGLRATTVFTATRGTGTGTIVLTFHFAGPGAGGLVLSVRPR
ncbi:MAG TPA: hypothetical protein VHS03_14590 [Gaiellaceae bacterium]|jgi:hypothetical protein|nr:hypothetical protein [Gaiellaceae bacterium]